MKAREVVAGVFGVRGEVRLHLHNREESVLLDETLPVVLVAPDPTEDLRARIETLFGEILRNDFHDLRDELVISTKAGYDMWPGPYGQGGGSRK